MRQPAHAAVQSWRHDPKRQLKYTCIFCTAGGRAPLASGLWCMHTSAKVSGLHVCHMRAPVYTSQAAWLLSTRRQRRSPPVAMAATCGGRDAARCGSPCHPSRHAVHTVIALN